MAVRGYFFFKAVENDSQNKIHDEEQAQNEVENEENAGKLIGPALTQQKQKKWFISSKNETRKCPFQRE